MGLFREHSGKLHKVRQDAFRLEKDIQNLTEDNLQDLFGLELVKSEFALNDLRIDTLAFDKETKSFVVIEYKRDKNFSVIDQGYAYLGLLLNNKADFILEYNENGNNTLKKNDVDWSQSRVIFISPSFSKYQREAINFKDLPIELWEISKYENGLIEYSQLKPANASESVKKISKKDTLLEKVSHEVKVYTEDDLLSNAAEGTKELYEKLKNTILSLGEHIEIKPRKHYIAFKAGSNFVDIAPQKNQLKLWLNVPKGKLDDPKSVARDVSNVGHWGNGDYEILANSSEELNYLMTLIQQSYNLNK